MTYTVLFIAVIIVKKYIVTPVRVNGESMMNTLHSKDIMLLNEITYKFNDIKRFDIVVIKINDENIIKRIIGLPGETVEYKENKLYINGKYYEEPFLKNNQKTYDFKLKDIDYKVIPKDCYFVLGDNRTNSTDSRLLGPISKDVIQGKTDLAIFPFHKFGKIN